MSLKKRSRRKSSKGKRIILPRLFAPFSISLFCLGGVITITIIFFMYHSHFITEELVPFPNNVVEENELEEDKTKTLLEMEEEVVSPVLTEKPVKFEFYSSLPSMKMTANKITEDPHVNHKSDVKKSPPLQSKPHISSASELEKDILRHIKHK